MKKEFLISSLILFFSIAHTSTTRMLYVDGFLSILGDITQEIELLSYAQSHDIEVLLLYDLHTIHATYDLTDPESNSILADFISLAKTNYGIQQIGAIGENSVFFTTIIDVYNTSRINSDEKFDIYNLEFEYWNTETTGPDGYYCTNYLEPNGLPCTVEGAFEFYISTLQAIHNLAGANSHTIATETYVGWSTAEQANDIVLYIDRLLLHAYVSEPNFAFNYTKDRILSFSNAKPNLDVSIIFSSEPSFMQDWLETNSMLSAENIFITDWENGSATWTNNIDINGFTYFAYSFCKSINLSTKQLIIKKGFTFPNPVQNSLYIKDFENLVSIKVYNNVGQLIIEDKANKIDFQGLNKGIYFIKIQAKGLIETVKILKQ